MKTCYWSGLDGFRCVSGPQEKDEIQRLDKKLNCRQRDRLGLVQVKGFDLHFKEPNGNKLAFEADADQALLVGILPDFIRDYLMASDRLCSLSEVVMDLGGFPEIRWSGELERLTKFGVVTQHHIDSFVSKLGAFNSDNRAGIERTLHRISAIRSRDGRILGVTCRIGRAIVGTISHLSDFIHSGKNILFLGPPGVGKTTQLRETARVLSTEFQKRVVIVDTSNEIGGDGDIPHPGIGFSRRMQVASRNCSIT